MQYVVPREMTLAEALSQLFPDSSRRTLQTWVKHGRFRLDGKSIARADLTLFQGQTLSIQETFRAPKVTSLKILYEDRHFIIVNKPVGLLSVPLDESQHKKHALGLLRESFRTDQIYAVHRIDRDTSGILLFARGKDSEEKFDRLFETHDILREYYAIVEGKIKDNQGTWESKLLELPSLQVVESPEGKDAITHYSVIRRSAKYTYLKLRLETGRKHQIRVHCQMAGHPIVGDARYGALENPLRRLCLHACTLGFKHPFTHKEVQFTSPLPANFAALGASSKR